jgi:hypothetical protein
MPAVQMQYGTEAQAITCTLASLANNAARQSDVVDNNSNKFLDVLCTVRITLANGGTIGNEKRVYVYAYGTVDAATPVYPDKVTGSDAAITLDAPSQLKMIGVIECGAYVSASVITFTMSPASVASAFGGIMPQKWGIVVENKTNIAFTSGEADKKKIYQGVKAESA